jgi:hypothetical protein
MYKIGDKVRVTKEGSHGFKIGEEIELIEKCENFIGSGHHWNCKSLTNDEEWSLVEYEFEPFKSKPMVEYTHYQKTVLKEELKEQRE